MIWSYRPGLGLTSTSNEISMVGNQGPRRQPLDESHRTILALLPTDHTPAFDEGENYYYSAQGIAAGRVGWSWMTTRYFLHSQTIVRECALCGFSERMSHCNAQADPAFPK